MTQPAFGWDGGGAGTAICRCDGHGTIVDPPVAGSGSPAAARAAGRRQRVDQRPGGDPAATRQRPGSGPGSDNGTF